MTLSMDEKPLSPTLRHALEQMSSRDVHQFILTVLSAYHRREQERLTDVLDGLAQETRWHRYWNDIKHKQRDRRLALTLFTEIIQAGLDGGDYPVLE